MHACDCARGRVRAWARGRVRFGHRHVSREVRDGDGDAGRVKLAGAANGLAVLVAHIGAVDHQEQTAAREKEGEGSAGGDKEGYSRREKEGIKHGSVIGRVQWWAKLHRWSYGKGQAAKGGGGKGATGFRCVLCARARVEA
eukprot:6206424-Pleurochrysis_carterae.AAC.1